MSRGNLGRTFPPEHRARISRALTGLRRGEAEKEKNRQAHLGKRPGPETRAKMSRAQKEIGTRPSVSEGRRTRVLGDKNPAWHGGIGDEQYAIGFTNALKTKVRARDGFACFICGTGENGRAHDVHHIDYRKTNHNPANLITLCHLCHAKTQFRREAWLCYFGR